MRQTDECLHMSESVSYKTCYIHFYCICVFGQDLSKTELAEPVIGFLKEMLTGPHAVRKTLEKYLGQ